MSRLQFVRNWTMDAWVMFPDHLLPPFSPASFVEWDGRSYELQPMQTTVIMGRVELSRRVVLGSE